eukprot:gene9933-20392_t
MVQRACGRSHEVRDALKQARKLSAAPPAGASEFAGGAARAMWLRHVERLIAGATRVAAGVAGGVTCLVHCSDGWDRTAQVVSLAKILLDPYYRTIRGFQVLMQTDWLAAGHKMADRHGTAEGAMERGEMSPVLLQWADAVWQVWRHFRIHFEFTEAYLLYVVDHSTSGRWGNFMYNTEQERRQHRLQERTLSLWDHINAPEQALHRPEWVNALYAPTAAAAILPQCWPRQLLWWEACHSRVDWEWTDLRETAADAVLLLGRQLEAARIHLRRLHDLVGRRPASLSSAPLAHFPSFPLPVHHGFGAGG